MNIQKLLNQRAQDFADKPAIIFKDTPVTFSELRDSAFKVANTLKDSSLNKGDKVAIFMPNFPEYIYSYFGVYSLGAVVVPLDFMLTEDELISFIEHAQCKVLICHPKKGIDFNQIKEKCPDLEKLIVMNAPEQNNQAVIPWDQVTKASDTLDAMEILDTDFASIFYTSGSTGKPKGVLLNYGHLDNPIDCITHFLAPSDQDSYLCAGVPFSHLGGLDYALFMLHFGSTLVLMDRFQPFETLKNLEKYKITIFCVVPAMFIAVLSIKECDKFDLSALKYPVVFGAPSSPELLKRFQQLCPNASLRNGWGMTETAAPNTYSPDDITKISSIGPLGVGLEAKIVDDEGKELGVNQQGELLVKGEAVMVGYYREDELTKDAFSEDKWFKTGDIALKNDEGLYYIVGRKKDMLKVGGEIVVTSEVENLMMRCPLIQEIAVIGVSDDLRGEVPKAFVVLREGQDASEESLKQFAKQNMANFKVPQSFEFRDSLPKNRVGKIDKVQLVKEIENKVVEK